MAWWDAIVRLFSGKKIVILGERGVGKTVLRKFLSSGEFVSEYKQTLGPEKHPPRSFKVKDLKLHIDAGLDVPGGEDQHRVWKELFASANYCFYLVRGDKLLAGHAATLERFDLDTDLLAAWKKQHRRTRVALLVTWMDHVPEYAASHPSTVGSLEDRIKAGPLSDKIKALGLAGSHVVFCSLGSQTGAETAVKRVFDAMSTT